MVLFSGQLPEIIRFGRGCRRQLFSLLPPGRIMVVCGRHSLELIRREFGNIREYSTAVVSGELPLRELEAVIEAARRDGCCNFIGWGGGSCIDGAKTVAALLDMPLSAAEAFKLNTSLDERSCFFAAIPTTAGTAAEMTPNAVLCDGETGVKKSLRGSAMFADAALIDPELLESAPLHVLYGSGFDALTQGIESTISAKADAMTMMLSIEGAFLTWQALQRHASGERSAELFDMLARGCMLSGAAFVRSGLGAAHGIGHPVSGLKGVPHGVCCAVLLPEVLKWNLPIARDAMEQLALRFGIASPEKLIDEIILLRRKCALPENFTSWQLEETDFPFIVKNCRSGSMKSNPRPFSDEEVCLLLERLI